MLLSDTSRHYAGYSVSDSPAHNQRDCEAEVGSNILSAERLLLNATSSSTGQLVHCPRKWDHLTCWPLSLGNSAVAIPCNASRSFVEIVLASSQRIKAEEIPGLAYQRCNGTGFWDEKTNYDECTSFLNVVLTEVEAGRRTRHAISAITFALCLLSTVLLLIALGIFTFFKSLKCDRLRVHKNFMLSLVFRYIISLIYYEPYIYGNEEANPWYHGVLEGYLCKFILVLLMLGQVSPIFWMFIEGAYLHSRIVTNVFDSPAPFKLYYCIGWLLPLVFTLSWTVTMVIVHDGCSSSDPTCQDGQTCWENYASQSYVAILYIPMMIALAVNLLFLVNIVRIVVTKVQHQMTTNQTETAHIRKAVRATVILFPLLGITNFLFFFKPEGGIYEKMYLFFNAILKSSQGIFLAVLYCFCNSEVQDTIKRHIRRITTRHDVRRSATLNTSRYNRDRYGNGGHTGGGGGDQLNGSGKKKGRCGSLSPFANRGAGSLNASPSPHANKNGSSEPLRLSILNRQLTMESSSPTTTVTTVVNSDHKKTANSSPTSIDSMQKGAVPPPPKRHLRFLGFRRGTSLQQRTAV